MFIRLLTTIAFALVAFIIASTLSNTTYAAGKKNPTIQIEPTSLPPKIIGPQKTNSKTKVKKKRKKRTTIKPKSGG
jgi:hypothetical protein